MLQVSEYCPSGYVTLSPYPLTVPVVNGLYCEHPTRWVTIEECEYVAELGN